MRDKHPLPKVPSRAIAVESYRSCALRSDGAVVCWGRDYGDGTSPPPQDVFETIVSGHGHSCGLDSTGDVTCWGYNGSGAAEPPPRTVQLRIVTIPTRADSNVSDSISDWFTVAFWSIC